MEKKEAMLLVARYVFLIIVAVPGLYLFYLIFTPLTAHPTKIIFESFFEMRVIEQSQILVPQGIGNSFFTNIYELFSAINSSFARAVFNPPTVYYLIQLNAFAELIPACIAGAAYYLLLVFNLTTPMNIKTRIKSIAFILMAFLVLNVIRIAFFAKLITKGYQYFDFAHMAVWYFGSTVMVLLIWFSNVLIFKIKGIPIYDDMKGLFSDLSRKRIRQENEKLIENKIKKDKFN